MNNKKFIPFDNLMEDIKQKDPQMYKEIKEEAKAEVEEAKKHGGLRSGAGRKKIHTEQKSINKRISLESFKLLEEAKKTYKVSASIILDTVIKKSLAGDSKLITPQDFEK